MSSPGRPGWSRRHREPDQYFDPITGQPLERNAPADHDLHPAGRGRPAAQGRPPGPSGTHHRDFETVEHARPQQPFPGVAGGFPPPEPPRRSRAPWITGIAAVATATLVIATTVLLTGGGSGNSTSAATAAPTPTESGSSRTRPADPAPATASPTTSPSAAESVREPVPPIVPGWQGMALLEFGIAYDIPPDWKAETGSTSGFETDSGQLVSMSGYSSYKRDFCTEADLSFRARVGMAGSDERDPTVAADNAFHEWARLGWGTEADKLPPVAMNPVQSVGIHQDRMRRRSFRGPSPRPIRAPAARPACSSASWQSRATATTVPR